MGNKDFYLKCWILIIVCASINGISANVQCLQNMANEEKCSETIKMNGSPEITDRASLQDYLVYASLNNPELEAAFNQWKAELEKVEQVKTLPDPQFNYWYFIKSIETRTGPMIQQVGISQLFPWFGKLRLKGKAALEAADSAQQRYEALKLKLFYLVKKIYYDLYYLCRSISITEVNIELVKQFEQISRTKYEAGTALFADIIKAQTELDILDDRLRSLLDYKDPLVAQFNALLNRPFQAYIPWPKSVPIIHRDLDDMKLAVLLEQRNPELKSLAYDIEQEKTKIALAKKDYFPDFLLGLDYIDIGKAEAPNISGSGQPALILKFSCNLPVWRKKYRAGKKEAKKKYLSSSELRENRQNSLDTSMKQALFKYRDASRKIALYHDAVIPKAIENLKVTQQAYESDSAKADFLTLIDAQRVLLELQLTYERAVTNHAQSFAELEMLVGKEL